MSAPRRHQQVDWTEFETARTTTSKPPKVEEQDKVRAEIVLANMPWCDSHYRDSAKRLAAAFAKQRADFRIKHGEVLEPELPSAAVTELLEASKALKDICAGLRRDLEAAERALNEYVNEDRELPTMIVEAEKRGYDRGYQQGVEVKQLFRTSQGPLQKRIRKAYDLGVRDGKRKAGRQA